jgi:hypothetical protein
MAPPISRRTTRSKVYAGGDSGILRTGGIEQDVARFRNVENKMLGGSTHCNPLMGNHMRV